MLPWIAKHSSVVPLAVRSILPESPAFIAYAGILFLIVYAIAGVTAIRSRPQTIAWLILAILLTARLENAILHLIESMAFRQYTPGVLTAALLVLPVTLYLLSRLLELDMVRRSWIPGTVAAAFAVQSAAIGAILLLGTI
jgi:hypothetical protein